MLASAPSTTEVPGRGAHAIGAGEVVRIVTGNGGGYGDPRARAGEAIAAVAEANGCILVTNNEKDFPGVECINPLHGIG